MSGLDAFSNQLLAAFNPQIKSAINHLSKLGAGYITTALPIPPKPVPLTATGFEILPFAEKIVTDPFKTFELNVLSEAELAVDNVIDYLSSILPADLIEELNNNLGVTEFLNIIQTDLPGAIYSLQSMLPNGVDIGNILRNTPLSTAMNYANDLLESMTGFSLDLNNVPASFIQNAFGYIESILGFSGSELLNLQGIGSQALFALGLTDSYSTNMVTNTAVILASVQHLAESGFSISTLTSKIGLVNASNIATLTPYVTGSALNLLGGVFSSIGFGPGVALVNNINAVSIPVFNTVTAAVNNFRSFSDAKFMLKSIVGMGLDLSKLFTQTLDLNYTTNFYCAKYMGTYGPTILLTQRAMIETHTATNILSLANQFDQLGQNETNSLLSNLKSLGDTGYAEIFGSSNSNSRALITQLGLDNARFIADQLSKNTLTDYITTIKVIESANSSDINQLATIGNSVLLDDLNKMLTVLSSDEAAARALLEVTHDKVLDSLNTVVNSNKITSQTEFINFTKTLVKIPLNTLRSTMSTLTSLTPDQLAAAVSQLNNNDIGTIFDNVNLVEPMLTFVIKKALEITAKAGNSQMTLTLINRYKSKLSKDYRNYIVTLLLKNYQLTSDDKSIGIKAASKIFTEILFTIESGWNKINRNDTLVYNVGKLTNASKHSLMLLEHADSTAIMAVLQNDYRFYPV